MIAQLGLAVAPASADPNHRPNAPTAADMSTSNPNSTCATRPEDAPHVHVTELKGITLRVTASDPDGDKVQVAFDFRENKAKDPLASVASAPVASGTLVSAPVLSGTTLTDGTIYVWQVFVQDVDAFGQVMSTSDESAKCYLVQDSTPPSQPIVTSADYPVGQITGGPGVPGVFTFTPSVPGDPDVAQYCYGLNLQSTPTCVPADAEHDASVTVIPTSSGPQDLFVRSVDLASNSSTVVDYHFFVKTPTPPVYWKMREGSGNTITSSDTSASTATLSPTGVAWTEDGRLNRALVFDGASGSVSATSTRVSTNRSFSVMAWVRLDASGGSGTAISQDGDRRSGFALGYDATVDRWVFSLPTADSDAASADRAVSTAAPQRGVWTHIAGVYDEFAGTTRLYVDGVRDGGSAHTAAWDAAGTVQLGRARTAGAPADFWPGGIDEVQVFDRAISDTDVATIVSSTPTLAAAWSFDETSGTVAADSSGNGLTAALDPGAVFTTDGHTAGGLALDGVTGSASTAGPAVRTDRSFTVSAWVKLSRLDSTFTVVSQDGTNTSGFTLQFRPDLGGRWVFSMPDEDAPGGFTLSPVVVLADGLVDSWVHVAGSYDASTGRCRLWVLDSFGASQRVSARSDPWNATGAMQFGRDLTVDADGNPAYGNYLAGVVDDVRVYTGVLSDLDLSELAGL